MFGTILSLLGPILGKVVDRVIPGDSEESRNIKLQIEAGIIKDLAAQNLAQLEINKIEAGSDNLFKSGWRPAVAWMGVFGLFYTTFSPLISYLLAFYDLPALPGFDTGELTTILMALLGLGGYRTFEKFKGITR